MIRVVIVGDHEVVRVGLASLLRDTVDFAVDAMAGSAAEAIEAIDRHHPDVVILDIRLPDRSGLDIVPDLRRIAPATKIVVLTSYGEDHAMVAAAAIGVDAFLTKTVDSEKLCSAIRAVAQGRQVLRDQVADALLRYVRDGEGAMRPETLTHALTPREVEVAKAVALGLSNREVAERLALAEKTVKNHVSDILDKLGLSRRAQIVALFTGGSLAQDGMSRLDTV